MSRVEELSFSGGACANSWVIMLYNDMDVEVDLSTVSRKALLAIS